MTGLGSGRGRKGWDWDWDDEPALLGELGRALHYDPSQVPPPERVEAIRAAARAMGTGSTDAQVTVMSALLARSRRRALLAGGIAAAFGGVGGYVAAAQREEVPTDTTATVPTEAITFDVAAAASGATVSSSALINHTWGTELLLEVTGLEAGSAYSVVFETGAGEVSAGSLLAVAEAVMKCRFNAAPLRAEVRAIEVRSPAGGVVLRSELSTV